ncbi:MAG: hypothetical protein ACRC92_20640 [Peptostreptococcaceae bacterium]
MDILLGNSFTERLGSTLLSSSERDFINNMGEIMTGNLTLNGLSDSLEFLKNPNGDLKEFEGDWLMDYFKKQSGTFNNGAITNMLGLQSSKLADLQRSYQFAQSSLDAMSNIGFGVGDFIKGNLDKATSIMGEFGASAMNYIRSNEVLNNLMSVAKIIDQPGDPLQYDMDMYISQLAEDSGFITDRRRATLFSRNFHFITRPYLESDSMGLYRSYVVFTRPNTNMVLRDKTGRFMPHPQLYKYKELSALVESDLELYAELCRDNCGMGNIFTLANNYCKEIPPVKLNETDREGVKNKFGFSFPVSGVSNNQGVDLSVTFMDNARGDIGKLFYALDLYKRSVSKEGYAKIPTYIQHNVIDTAMSAYIITVDTNFNIIGFGVAIGLLMSDPPSHFTRHSIDGFSKDELLSEFTINFKCFDYSPHDPSYFDAFNRITGFDPSRVVDTRGSSKSLMVNMSGVNIDKSSTSKEKKYKTSVFDVANGGYNGRPDLSTSKMSDAKSTFLNKIPSISTTVINKAKDLAKDYGILKSVIDGEVANTAIKTEENFGYYMPYADTFEYLGRFPGVYAHREVVSRPKSAFLSTGSVSNENDNYKIVYRFGWSR